MDSKVQCVSSVNAEWPLELNVDTGKQEMELVSFAVVEGLLKKTGLVPADIDILITTCSMFNIMPSMACEWDVRCTSSVSLHRAWRRHLTTVILPHRRHDHEQVQDEIGHSVL